MNLARALASAILLPLALPNEIFDWGIPWLGVIALVPLFVALIEARSTKEAIRLGALFGAVSTALGNYWLAFFGDFSTWTLGGAVLGYTGYNALLGGFLFVLTRQGVSGVVRSRAIRLAIAWTGYEYFKSVGFLGYPWGLVAYPIAWWQPVAQIAELGGVWPLSFLAAFANSAIAEVAVAARSSSQRAVDRLDAYRRSEHVGKQQSVERLSPTPLHPIAWPTLGAAVALFAVAAGFGIWRLPTIIPNDSMRVLLVQQNVDAWRPGRFEESLLTAQRLTLEGLVGSAGDEVAMVVWSESVLQRPYGGAGDQFYLQVPAAQPFAQFLAAIDRPLVTGGPMPAAHSPGDYTNSALVIDSDSTLLGSYGKRQLVPFAESIPGWHLPVVQRFFREVIGLYGSWVPGAERTVVRFPAGSVARSEVTIGMPICFEDAFGWVTRDLAAAGATVMVNLTDNSWSRQVSAQTQHLVAARLRTIELRRPLVRGTNSGVSAVIDARGFVTEALPMFQSMAEVVEVPLYATTPTMYAIIGDLVGVVFAWGSVAGVAIWAWRRRSCMERLLAAPISP